MKSEQGYTNGLASIVNGYNGNQEKAEALQPGEFRYGNIRMYPKTNEAGEAIIRMHVTNEVEMYLAKNRLAVIKACMWIVISALVLATFSGLVVHFHSF